MQWKQFFTPVRSMRSDEAKQYLDTSPEDVVLLDVRQPGEYQASHIPGATLIPLGDLLKSLDQLDKDIPILIY